jgi:hypothetical protein
VKTVALVLFQGNVVHSSECEQPDGKALKATSSSPVKLADQDTYSESLFAKPPDYAQPNPDP